MDGWTDGLMVSRWLRGHLLVSHVHLAAARLLLVALGELAATTYSE